MSATEGTDGAYLNAVAKLEIATRIWREKRTNEYEEAERLYQEAVAIRNKSFP
jgi:hypothetical protein